MSVSHAANAGPNCAPAMAALQQFLQERRRSGKPAPDFLRFEEELQQLFAAAQCEALGEELARQDVDLPLVLVDGVAHRRVLRCEQVYFAPSGPVRVERSLYSTRSSPGEAAVCPMEVRAGIVEGSWTPRAAKQALWFVAQMPPQTVEELYRRLGGLMPSKSSLDRLPKAISENWEPKREQFEQALRQQEQVPGSAVAVAASLDGVMLPMKDGQREQKRQKSLAEGRRTRGPAGRQEVGCATLSFYDKAGEPLHTTRLARMPEACKATLKTMLTAELSAVVAAKPTLSVVLMGDGALDNWRYLGALKKSLVASWPGTEFLELIDFCHGAEHLAVALNAAYGENSPPARAQFEKLRHLLRHDSKGVEKVIRALVHLRKRRPRKKAIKTELAYFRKNRRKMRYAELAARGLPIGTGITEAACKTLVTQRMRCSGMAWRHPGGQAILTLRSLTQSKRFDAAWALIAAGYSRTVTIPDNVIPLCRPGN